MIEKELLVIGRLGNLINDNDEFQFIPNDNFQPAVFDKVTKLYLIFTEHRVFFVEVKKLSIQKSKYWISFNDDGVKEEFELRKSVKLAIPKNQYHAINLGNTFQDITDFHAYEDGLYLGVIVDFIDTPGDRVIVVVDGDDNELLIPEVDYYIKEIKQAENIVYFQNTKALREL
jgi:ribosomal 30S subunit maturation factor RimM